MCVWGGGDLESSGFHLTCCEGNVSAWLFVGTVDLKLVSGLSYNLGGIRNGLGLCVCWLAWVLHVGKTIGGNNLPF